MKTKFYFLVISLLAICSVCLPACDNDEKGDVTKPVIDLIEPEEGAVLKIGNGKGVHFEMNLSDDVMLRSYKINIHNKYYLKLLSCIICFYPSKTWIISN